MYSAGGQQNLGGGGAEDGSAENSETEENMDTEEGVVEVSAWVLIINQSKKWSWALLMRNTNFGVLFQKWTNLAQISFENR